MTTSQRLSRSFCDQTSSQPLDQLLSPLSIREKTKIKKENIWKKGINGEKKIESKRQEKISEENFMQQSYNISFKKIDYFADNYNKLLSVDTMSGNNRV